MSLADGARRTDERALITPEGVDLRVRVAGPGERLAALMIDAALIIGIMIVGLLLCLGAGWVMGFRNAEFLFVLVVVGGFLLRNGWFIAFELTPYAATPGKRATGLRVAARNGGRLTAGAILARNGMRELELFLPLTMVFGGGGEGVDGWMYLFGVVWAGVFALFPLFNRDHLRVGDLVAGTWVVHAPKVTLLRDMVDDQPVLHEDFAFTLAQLDAYGVKELHVLEDVLRKADRKVMAAVAERIRAKVGWTAAAYETDRPFLQAYYTAVRGRLETRMLLGRRKRDKFDRD
ncbi:MAG: RDD family protein [Caulobacter sp.]|nr:RDD family protein [Caulobacter sp.]